MGARRSAEDALKGELAKRVGPVGEGVWDVLVATHVVESTLLNPTPLDGLDDLEAIYRKVKTAMGSALAFPADEATVQPEVGEDCALRALSEILALQAADEKYVVAFRDRVLGGQLIPHGGVASWEGERQKTQQLVSRPPGSIPGIGARETPREAEAALDEHLSSTIDLGPEASRGDYELDFLFCVVDVLCAKYGWTDVADVSRFVLSGTTPALHPFALSMVLAPNEYWAGGIWLVMRVSPRLQPKDLMALYSSSRRIGIPPYRQRQRPVTAPSAALVVFAASVNDGRSWTQAMAQWNEDLEAARERVRTWDASSVERVLAYADVAKFARDCRRHFSRVTGASLVWKGPKNGSSQREVAQNT